MRKFLLFVFPFGMFASGCHPGPDQPGLSIARIGDDGSTHALNGPLALGGEIELDVAEPDPANPGFVRSATVTSVSAEPADALSIVRQSGSRIVVKLAREGDARLDVTTGRGMTGGITLPIHRPARIEAQPYVGTSDSLTKMPASLVGRTFRLASPTPMGFDAVAYDADNARLEGYAIADWTVEPASLATFEPFASRDNLVRVRPGANAGMGTLHVVARGSEAAASVPIAIEASVPEPTSLIAFHEYCGLFECNEAQPLAVDASHARLDDVTVGATMAIDVFAVDASGAIILGGAPAAPTVGPDGAAIDAFSFVSPNTVFVSPKQAGDASITIAYMGFTTTVDVHAVVR